MDSGYAKQTRSTLLRTNTSAKLRERDTEEGEKIKVLPEATGVNGSPTMRGKGWDEPCTGGINQWTSETHHHNDSIRTAGKSEHRQHRSRGCAIRRSIPSPRRFRGNILPVTSRQAS